jgi:segregation and condensation protein B
MNSNDPTENDSIESAASAVAPEQPVDTATDHLAAETAVESAEETANETERSPDLVPTELLPKILEGAMLAAGRTLSLNQLEALFTEFERPPRDQIKAALDDIASDCAERGFELQEVASGYRFQVRQELAEWVSRLWDEKPKRYSRAMLETLALVAYRQPLTRGDIEQVRGVAVSSDIIKSLQEREWVRVVGHRDVPGKPALYATTRQFLDYFNLKSLDELPPLSELKDFAQLDPELELALALDPLPMAAANDVANDVESDVDSDIDNDVAIGSDSEPSAVEQNHDQGQAQEQQQEPTTVTITPGAESEDSAPLAKPITAGDSATETPDE